MGGKEERTLSAFLLKTKQQLAFPIHLTVVTASWEYNGNEKTTAMSAIPATLIPTTDRTVTLFPTSIRKKLGSFASASESQAIKNDPFFHNLLSDTCSVKYASRLVLMTNYV